MPLTAASHGMPAGYFGAMLALELRYAVPRTPNEAFRWRMESRRRGPRKPHPAGPDRVTRRGVGPWSEHGAPALRADAGRFMQYVCR